jgi:Family of unknown function (DUF6308)
MALRIAGATVDDPMPIWRAYARLYGGTIRGYDLREPGDPNVLTPDEAWCSRIIGSRMSRRERDEFVERAAEAGCPWGEVRADADLADADPAATGGDFDHAADLYWFFTSPDRIRGVRVAKLHKVLHVKRPGLYPILDKQVRNLYQVHAMPWVGELARLRVTIKDSPPYWAAIRDDLVVNGPQLRAYRQELSASGDEMSVLVARLTILRLQDIVAWHVAPRT